MPLHKRSMAAPSQPQTNVSKTSLYMIVALVAVIGYVAGTRHHDILGAVGPALGIKVASGTLDFTPTQDVYRELKANYDGTLNESALVEGATRGMVAAAGDQYTVYMDAKEAKAFNDDLSGTIGGGIGAEIGIRNSQPTIVRVLEGNPAQKAGLLAGDTIKTINDQNAFGWNADKAATTIRGEAGTTVKLEVVRGAETKTFTITRAVVNNPSVTHSVVNGLGILRISRFDDQTATLARQAAQDMKRQSVRGVILDVRGNGGGYLTAAQDVAGIWLDKKAVVSERTGGKVVDTITSGGNPVLAGVPTIVLIDNGTASASEIVAGALQDYGVATLVGEKSFGKGTVQKVIDVSGGGILKVTTARWYTPKGKNITSEGITPNKVVALSAEDNNAGRDPQLDAAKAELAK